MVLHRSRLPRGPFVKIVDKSKGDQEIIASLEELLATGIPEVARKLHDELDRVSGSYLWGFLEARWNDLESSSIRNREVLERLVRRRAALQLGRLDPTVDDPTELQVIDAVEYYIYPPISDEFRLGEIIRSKHDRAIRIVMTPHCHLTIQQGAQKQRADHILTLKAFPAEQVLKETPWSGKEVDLRRITRIDAELGKPRGRYCFLPGFLDIPDLYCDLLQMESLPFETITQDFEKLAVLDTPFAEALQSCFSRFYSAVGPAKSEPRRQQASDGMNPSKEEWPIGGNQNPERRQDIGRGPQAMPRFLESIAVTSCLPISGAGLCHVSAEKTRLLNRLYSPSCVGKVSLSQDM